MSLKDDKKEINNIKQEVHELQEQSDLYRILTLEDKKNKRLCGIISLLVILLVISLGYTIYLTSDIGTVEDTITQADKVYLTDIQKRIIEYRMLDYSIVKMASLENCGTATISRELNKALYKLGKQLIKK